MSYCHNVFIWTIEKRYRLIYYRHKINRIAKLSENVYYIWIWNEWMGIWKTKYLFNESMIVHWNSMAKMSKMQSKSLKLHGKKKSVILT